METSWVTIIITVLSSGAIGGVITAVVASRANKHKIAAETAKVVAEKDELLAQIEKLRNDEWREAYKKLVETASIQAKTSETLMVMAENRIKILCERQDKTDSLVDALRGERDARDKKIEERDMTIQSLRDEITKMQRAFTKLKSSYDELQRENDIKSGQIKDMEAEIAKLKQSGRYDAKP